MKSEARTPISVSPSDCCFALYRYDRTRASWFSLLPLLTVLQMLLSAVQLWICPNQRFMLFSIQVTFRHICNMKAYSIRIYFSLCWKHFDCSPSGRLRETQTTPILRMTEKKGKNPKFLRKSTAKCSMNKSHTQKIPPEPQKKDFNEDYRPTIVFVFTFKGI